MFLIGWSALAAVAVVIVAATFVYIVLYQMPIHVKAEIGDGSALAMAGISFLFTSPGNAARADPPAGGWPVRANARCVRREAPPQAGRPAPGQRRSARDGAAMRGGVVRAVPGAAGAGRAVESGCKQREFRRSGHPDRTAARWCERTGNFLAA